MVPLVHPQNKTHSMFICLHVHVLVLIHEVEYLHGGGGSFGLGGTGSIMGMMPTSVVSYPYWSGSNMVTEGVGPDIRFDSADMPVYYVLV